MFTTLFSCPRSRFLCTSSFGSISVVTLSDNDSKQIAAVTSFRMSAFNTKNFVSEGQKKLVNSENKENLSNYQLLKRKPSVCSTSLHFSKVITVVRFFFPVTPVLQWFQLRWLPRVIVKHPSSLCGAS